MHSPAKAYGPRSIISKSDALRAPLHRCSVGMDAASAALMATVFDVAGILGSVATGFLCDSVFDGWMITTTLPFIICAGVAFVAWGGVCLAEQVRWRSCRV